LDQELYGWPEPRLGARPAEGDPHEAGRWAKRDKVTGQITLVKDERYQVVPASIRDYVGVKGPG
jgi:hypothetical protein